MPNFVPISESLRKVYRGNPCEQLTPESTAVQSSTALTLPTSVNENAIQNDPQPENEAGKNEITEEKKVQENNNALQVDETKLHKEYEGGNGQMTHHNYLGPNSIDEFNNADELLTGNSFILDIDFGGTSETLQQNQNFEDVHKVQGHKKATETRAISHSKNKSSCCNRGKYAVSDSLKHKWKTQAHFFSRIMLTKGFQSIMIAIWTYIFMYWFEDELITYFTAIEIFVLMYCCVQKLLIYSSKDYCVRKPQISKDQSKVCWLFLALALEGVCIGGICAATCVYYNTTIFLIAIWILSLSYITVSIIPHTTKSKITRWKHLGFMSAVIFIVSVIFMAFKLYQIQEDYIHYFLTVYVPATLISLAIILSSHLWICLIISGSIFKIHEGDWVYVAAFA